MVPGISGKMMLPPDPLYIFKGDMAPVMCLLLSKRDQNISLYAGTQTGKVHIWDLKSHREIGNFQSSNESCLSIHVINEDAEIITQDKMGVIKFWIERSLVWTLMKEIKTDYYGFCKTVLYHDILYAPVNKANIESVSIKMKDRLDTFSLTSANENNEIMCFRIFNANDEAFAIVAFESCDLSLYSMKEKKIRNSIKVDECPMALEFDAVSMKGVCGCPTEKLLVFYITRNSEIQFKRNIVLKSSGVASLAIRPDCRLLAVGCWDGRLRLYSVKSSSVLAVLDIHSSTIQDVAFFDVSQRDEKSKFYLFVGSKDGKISVWDLYN